MIIWLRHKIGERNGFPILRGEWVNYQSEAKHSPLFLHFEQTQEISDNALIRILKRQMDYNRPFAALFMRDDTRKSNELWKIGTLAQFELITNHSESMRVRLAGLDRIKLLETLLYGREYHFQMAIVDKFTMDDVEAVKLYDAVTLVIVNAIKDIIQIEAGVAETFLAS